MAYTLYKLTGTAAQQQALKDAHGLATQEQRRAIEPLYRETRAFQFTVYWVPVASFPAGGNLGYDNNGNVVASAFKGGIIYVDSALSGTPKAVQAILAGANGIAELYKTREKPAPPTPPKKPEPGVDPVDADIDTALFGGEDDTLYHALTHTAVPAAIFYANATQAKEDGRTPDGACIV